jgi:hypothetical protein
VFANTGRVKKFRMSEEAGSCHSPRNEYIHVPRTKLTLALQELQLMFPNVNTAIIDRVLITSNGNLSLAADKLLQISSKFP